MSNISQSGSISVTTTLTDQANGNLLIDTNSVQQEAQRPIMELPTLVLSSVDTNADWFDVWDSSAAQMVRVPAMRPS